MAKNIPAKLNASSPVMYRTLSSLEYDKPYCVIGLSEVKNSYGTRTGMICLLKDTCTSYRVCLPRRYSDVLDEHDIDILKGDIAKEKNPFLIVRDEMIAMNQYIDFLPYAVKLKASHKNWQDVSVEPKESCKKWQYMAPNFMDINLENDEDESDKTKYLNKVFDLLECPSVDDHSGSKEESIDDLIKSNLKLINSNEEISYEEDDNANILSFESL